MDDSNGDRIDESDQSAAIEMSLGTDAFAVVAESASPMRPRFATSSENTEVLPVLPINAEERFGRRVDGVA